MKIKVGPDDCYLEINIDDKLLVGLEITEESSKQIKRFLLEAGQNLIGGLAMKASGEEFYLDDIIEDMADLNDEIEQHLKIGKNQEPVNDNKPRTLH